MKYGEPIEVNRALGKQIKLGIFDGTQLCVFLVYGLLTAFLSVFLSISPFNGTIVWFSLCFPTVLFLGDKPWKSIRRVMPCPTVMRCGVYYQRLLPLARKQ
jgi:hypothetical protein